MKQFTEAWKEDCMHYRGRILTGQFAHYCYDWDELPVDETCEEFEVCTCYGRQLSPELYEKKLQMILKNSKTK